MLTRAVIRFGIFDTTAKQEAVYTSADVAAFATLDALAQEAYEAARYATLELNQWILDANQIQPPETLSDGRWGVLSSEISDADGVFVNPMAITATFTNPHTSAGITLYMLDWAEEVQITWYDDSDVVLETKTFNPDSNAYFAVQYVEGYYKVLVEFTKSVWPYSQVALTGIQYGTEYLFATTELQTANITEEISPISECLMAGTLNVVAIPTTGSFGIMEPTGMFAALQTAQKLEAFSVIDGVEELLGTFYLNDWSAADGVKVLFKCVDIIGLIGERDCLGGLYDSIGLETLLNTVFTGLGITFVVDEQLSATTLSGWIPVTNYRTALQHICFAAGAVAIVLPDSRIFITPLSDIITTTFDEHRKFVGQRLEKRREVTDAEVIAHEFYEAVDEEETQLIEETYLPGTYTIYFNEPVFDLSCTGATIDSSSVNHAVITVAVEGAVTLVGKVYSDSRKVFRVARQTPLAGGSRSYISVDKCTMLSTLTGQYVAQKLYDYYEYPRKIAFQAVRDDEHAGDIARVFATSTVVIAGPITRMVLNLIGMVADFTIVGDVYDLTTINDIQKLNTFRTGVRPVV